MHRKFRLHAQLSSAATKLLTGAGVAYDMTIGGVPASFSVTTVP